MAIKVDIDDFANEIAEQLTAYSDDVDEIMKAEIDKTAKDAKREILNHAIFKDKSGDYRKGFQIKKVAEGRGYKRLKLANKKYQITHLLEYGHITRDVEKRSRYFPHWKYGQDVIDKLPDRLKEAIKKND